MDTLFRVAWEKVDPELIDGYLSGMYRMYNGVLRNSANHNEILKHLPLEPFDLPERMEPERILATAQQLASAKMAVGSMVAVSTAAIIGVVVVSTMYLAHRLEQLNKSIAAVQKELHDQNVLFYIDKLTAYTGNILTLWQLARNRAALQANPELVLHLLAEANISRNRLLSLVGLLLQAMNDFSPAHKALVIDFVNMSLDLIPKGAVIESQTAYMLERFELGDMIRLETATMHKACIDNYQQWFQLSLKEVVAGKGSQHQPLLAKRDSVRALVCSEENQLILAHSF